MYANEILFSKRFKIEGGKMLDNKGFDLWADGYDKSVGLSDDKWHWPDRVFK